jgi:ornithine carbamoyltransferase
MQKDFLSIKDLNKDEIMALIDRGLEIKSAGRAKQKAFEGHVLGLIFSKASTRTRVSFETAMFRLGGQVMFLKESEMQVARNEPIKDTARVLSRYLDVLAVRTYSQNIIEEMALWADIPVINALTDMYHPCQVLSDLLTVKEKLGRLENLKIAWIGDGNNMAHSWINAAAALGFDLVLACPPGYQPDRAVLDTATANVRVVEEAVEAARDADVINTDVWASMGQEAEQDQRLSVFRSYQVDRDLVDKANPEVLVMHCLPAHRGEEIVEEVLEGPRSVVFDQAENKMHLHQALLERLLAAGR